VTPSHAADVERPALEVTALTRRFGRTTALDGVSFEVPRGAKVALLGSNGAGKSTLLAILSTLLSPASGTVRIEGFDVAREGNEVRRRIGVLAHRPMLYEQFTPLENLEFFGGLYGQASATRIEALLRRIGLWTRRDEPTEVFSRGYHQRLAIARALVHEPSVLLLDEPETGLDEEGIALLDELMLRAPGITVLAATHRRDRIEGWADAVVELHRGRVRAPVEAPSSVTLSTGAPAWA
jgi:heme exporter protein A